MYIIGYMCGYVWYIMYIMMYIIVGLCLGYLMVLYGMYCVMLIWFYIVFVCGLCDLVGCDLVCSCASPVWLCPDGFMPDFIVIDVIYYFLIAYNVWLYIYVFRRILLFLYVVECRFCLVFIGFMLFMVLWSYFLFMQNFTIVHGRMYWRTPLLYIFCISMNIYYIDHI